MMYFILRLLQTAQVSISWEIDVQIALITQQQGCTWGLPPILRSEFSFIFVHSLSVITVVVLYSTRSISQQKNKNTFWKIKSKNKTAYDILNNWDPHTLSWLFFLVFAQPVMPRSDISIHYTLQCALWSLGVWKAQDKDSHHMAPYLGVPLYYCWNCHDVRNTNQMKLPQKMSVASLNLTAVISVCKHDDTRFLEACQQT